MTDGEDRYNSDGSGAANDYSPPPSEVRFSYPTYDQGKDLEVDREALRRIANDLEADLEELRPALDEVINLGGVLRADHLGGSPTATQLVQTARNAHEGFSQYYGELHAAYVDLVGKLRASAENYGQAEGQNVENAENVDAGQVGDPGAPTTANTDGWEPS